jgi:PadR family transcriptional regulator PadR
MAAWLLLLLRDGESYGRALSARLSERGVGVETGFSYRTLRALEREGAIASRWTDSHHGPRRRSYRLTSKGRRMLAEHAAGIAATLRVYDAFAH